VSPRVWGESVHPRLQSAASGRPLNFTVRRRPRDRRELLRRSSSTLGGMGAVTDWQCFLACPDEASAAPVAEYLRLHDCPALVFPVPPSFDLAPTAEVRVPAQFLHRARHIWARADTFGDLTDGELEYLATGKLPGASRQHDDAA